MSADRMKSAFEKAMERVDSLEPPREEQLLEWDLLPEGQRLAGSYLRSEGAPFSKISNAPPKHKPYLARGMVQSLLTNLQLPKSEPSMTLNNRILEGLERLTEDVSNRKETIQRLRYVLDQYSQFGLPQRNQAYEQLKLQMEQQITEAMTRQTGGIGSGRINVEAVPEFQQQWLHISTQIDHQYEQHLDELRQQLLGCY